jgi:metal-responsive CopG/Arc/MetJ family transcriptional regulator
MKRLTIAIPDILMNKFKQSCRQNYKTMSEALRDYIKEYIKQTDNTCQNTTISKEKNSESG